MTYTKIGEISEECRAFLLEAIPERRQIGGNPGQDANYQTTGKIQLDWIRHPEVESFIPFDRWAQSICVEIPPHGHLHKHTHDLERDQGKTRYHFVLETNPSCRCLNGEEMHILEDRGVYYMEPYLPHESWNEGKTSRKHLILVTDD